MKKLMVNKNYYGKRRFTHVADSTDVQTEMQFGQSKIDKCKYPKSLWVCTIAYASIQFYFTTLLIKL